MTPFLFRFGLCVILWVLVCVGLQVVQAHEGRPVYIQLTQIQSQPSRYLLLWKVPPVLAPGTEPRISLIATECKQDTAATSNQPLIGSNTYQCSSHPKELWVEVNYPKSNPALSTLIVMNGLDGHSQTIFSGPEQQRILLPNIQSLLEVAQQYIRGGISHLLRGFDHLLFILCLMLVAGTLGRMLIAATGFTLAHTLTLILASLNIIRVSAPLVEALIALSIVLLAAHIAKVRYGETKSTLTWQHPVLTATTFGLLHGLGFASVLSELGLPLNAKIPALLFFNLGVEIGQFLFIAVALAVALVFRKLCPEQVNRRLLNGVVYGIGVIASYWLIQRLF